ncbi:diguanylate cyclase domain-containing protein [Actinoplanes sp. NPDC020271]|uniref:diguanylate cyclase domain-containing protein n=1 Tax=Actinoplanes sp. NPDC020271 TaxID=3363896 RepID=UPI003791FC62
MRRQAGDPVLLAVVLGGLLLVPLFLTGLAGNATSWTAQTVIDVLDVLFAWQLARHPDVAAAGRRFWRAVVVACGASAIGDGFQTISTYAGAGSRISVVQTAFVVTGMVIVVAATLRHPLGGEGRQRLRLWLDAATVLTGVAAFLWYFLLAIELNAQQAIDRWGAAATAVVMLLIAFGVLKMIFSGTAPFFRLTGVLGCLALAGTALGASVAGVLFGDEISPQTLYVVQFLPCVTMAVTLRLQWVLTRPFDPAAPRGVRQRPSVLPYVAVIATQLLVLYALRNGAPGLRTWGVAVGAVAITALVLARQLSAVRDNERLMTELDQQREWFRALVQNASDLTVVVRDGVVAYAGPAARQILGVDPEELVGTSLRERTHPDDRPRVEQHIALLRAGSGTGVPVQVRWRHADGTYRWVDVISTDMHHNPSIHGFVLNVRDAGETRALHDELQRQATHDALTGLANRVLLQRRIDEAAATGPGVIGMLLIDLDGFKEINDRHGHHTGDQVLVMVAERLAALLGAGEVAARLGGDEFAVLLPGTGAEAAALADRITAVLAEPMMIGGQWLTVGASVGVATGGAGEGDRLLREADAAMYQRKHHRKAALP